MQWLAHHSGSRVLSPLCRTAPQLGNLYGMGGVGIAISFVWFGLSIFEQKYFISNVWAIIRGVRIRGFALGAVWWIRLPTERLMWQLYPQHVIDVKSLSCSCTNEHTGLAPEPWDGQESVRAERDKGCGRCSGQTPPSGSGWFVTEHQKEHWHLWVFPLTTSALTDMKDRIPHSRLMILDSSQKEKSVYS